MSTIPEALNNIYTIEITPTGVQLYAMTPTQRAGGMRCQNNCLIPESMQNECCVGVTTCQDMREYLEQFSRDMMQALGVV